MFMSSFARLHHKPLLLLTYFFYLAVNSALRIGDISFMVNVGEQGLPRVYMFIALTMGCVTILLLQLLRQMAVRSVLQWTMLCASILYLGEGYLLSAVDEVDIPSSFWYFMRTLHFVLYASLNLCFWSYLDQFVTLQEAKRFFIFVAGANFLGCATSGWLISIPTITIPDLLQGAALILIGCLTAIYLTKTHVTYTSEESDDPVKNYSLIERVKVFFSVALKTPFVGALFAYAFVSQILFVLAEARYYADFERAFPPTPIPDVQEPLAIFMGQTYAGINLINIVFGLWLFRALIHWLGTNYLMLLSPSLFLFVFCLWPFDQTLFSPLMALFIGETIMTSVDDNALHLLVSALGPYKNHFRVIILAMAEPLATLIASQLLSLNAPTSWGLIIAILAFISAILVRIWYPMALTEQMNQHFPLCHTHHSKSDFQNDVDEWLETYTPHGLSGRTLNFLLEYATDKEALYPFFQQLSENEQTALITAQVKKHQKSFFSLTFLKCILIQTKSEPLMAACLWAIAHQESLFPDWYELANRLQEPLARGALLLDKLKQPQKNTSNAPTLKKLRRMLQRPEAYWREIALAVARAARYRPFLSDVVSALDDSVVENQKMAAQALYMDDDLSHDELTSIFYRIESMADSSAEKVIPLYQFGDPHDWCENMLDSSFHRSRQYATAVHTLIQLWGQASVYPLIRYWNNRKKPVDARYIAACELKELASSHFKEQLTVHLTDEVNQTKLLFWFAETIPKNDCAELDWLRETLFNRAQLSSRYVLKLILLNASYHDPETMLHWLFSSDVFRKNQAIETLNRLTPHPLCGLIAPLLDQTQLHRNCKELFEGDPIFTQNFHDRLDFLLTMLEDSPYASDNIAAFYTRKRLGYQQWKNKMLHKSIENDKTYFNIVLDILKNDKKPIVQGEL